MRTLFRTAVVVLTTFLMAMPAFAWGDPGHMLVTQIAYDNLNETAKARVDELAQLVVFRDTEYDFVTLSCWMDDIRSTPALEPIKDWHFITLNFGISTQPPPPPVNVQSILDWSIARLRAGRDSERVTAYTLAYLAHLTGDVHQPLHCATRTTTARPDGDRGGNLFFLHADAIRPNLHSYWDGAAGLFDEEPFERPLNTSERRRLRSVARSITQAFPASSINNLNNLTPETWVRESHELAKTEAYVGVTENSIPDTDYVTKTQRTARRRIATAGYRLARVLNASLGNTN